jgi:lipoyl(octanoyl) transferase
MLALQERRHQDVAAGEADDTLFLIEHDPVITLGRNAGAGHVLADRRLLRSRGVEVHTVGRGGDVTYHGPGQLVGYPIVALEEDDGEGTNERDVKRFVGILEEIMIRTAADFGVEAERVEGLRGIWVGHRKLGAVGVRISRWVTQHGFAFNVTTDLRDFGLIVPCGLHGRDVTSLHEVLGDRTPDMDTVADRVVEHAALLLNRRPFAAEATALPVDLPLRSVAAKA